MYYTKFYGDGDSKVFSAVENIYGPKKKLKKYECIGHYQKRVGTRLRKLKSVMKGLGGRGRLTDAKIDILQNYFGIALRQNVGNLSGMEDACRAWTLLSTMRNAQKGMARGASFRKIN